MSETAAAGWTINASIASEPLEACDLIRQIVARLEDEAWDDAGLFAVHMALEEAVMNAIKHGNQRDVAKQVHICVASLNNELSVVVRDEGPGFNPECVPDPTEDENLEKPCGRGVLLIREFMDEVSYNDRGNEVRMLKRKG